MKPLRRNEIRNLWTRVPSLRWAALFSEVSFGVPPDILAIFRFGSSNLPLYQ